MSEALRDPQEAFAELVAMSGLDGAWIGRTSLSQQGPRLATRYNVGAAGAAALALAAAAGAELWRLKTGEVQDLELDAAAATMSLRGNRYLKIDGETPPLSHKDPLSGFYRARDGRWFFLHSNFVNHRDRNLAVLNCEPSRESIAEAALQWDGEALEEAIVAASGCGGLVRTHEEWDAHPQGVIAAQTPPLIIERIGDAPVQPLSPGGNGPLSGIRALDLSRVIAGPTCGRLLAEHGADVLKISRSDLPNSGQLEIDTGIGKRSAFLDLRDPAQAQQMRDLVRQGDVFSQAYRPHALEGRGFGPQELAELRSGIVCVSLSAFGHIGPWQNRRGYDTVVQAVNGMADGSGLDGTPKHQPVQAVDYVAGNLMAAGAMIALARRAREGGSWLVRVSLASVGAWIIRQGVLPIQAWRGLPIDFPQSEVAPHLRDIQSPFGLLSYFGSPVRMSLTPPLARLPAVPLGSGEARWLPLPAG